MMETENIPATQSNVYNAKPINILCSMCALAFNPSESKTNICPKCIVNQTDITVGIFTT
jgi:Zn finger protein HypA/HybF involved in hydrogenase expression